MKNKSTLEIAIAALPTNPRKARVWSLEEDACLVKYAEEKGFEAIARILGVNGMAIRRRFEYLKKRVKN